MADNFDSAVGAVLEIPTEALQKISQAEQRIKRLGAVSEAIAENVRKDWAITAVGGLQTFINKIRDTEQELGKIGKDGINFNINTTVAQQNLESLSSQTKKTTSDISANLQKLSYTDIDFSNIKLSLETLGASFGQVEQLIKSMQETRKVQILEGDPQEQVQQLSNMIQKLKEYLDIRKKSSEQIEAAEKKQAEAIQKRLEAEQKALQRKADTDRNAAEQLLNNLYSQRLNILSRIEAQNTKVAAEQRGLTTAETQMATLLANQLSKIDTEISNLAQKYPQLAQAARVAFNADYAKAMADENIRLEQALNKSADAQQRLKDANIKSLLSEYKQLTKEAESLARSMKSYRDSGGNITDPKYQAIEQQWTAVIDRMNAIERQQIAEITQFRNQQYVQSLQADLSAFVQNEAQKRAEAQKTFDEQIQKAKLAGQQYAQSFAGAMSQFSKLMDDNNTSSKFVMNLENVKRILNDLKTASGKLNLLDPNDAQKAERIKKAIEQLTKILNRYKEVASDKVEPTFASAQQAVATARATKSLQDYKAAYEQLKAVMSKMDSSSPAFQKANQDLQEIKKRIDQINKSMGEFKGQTKQSTDLMNQLGNRIAAAFSIGAIAGFLKKMVDIRAQFELQRVALGAIIQDTDEANKTFVKIQNMALESPFTIMQLERATKQIAAFGFETQKLVPTMKMFADISAGLGVEIDRLVLVMGHLKARNFLEGTMVRQFTNMGFNILGNLAEYYTELEGKMISVGEVQDRVKKKMISFEDVEEVLKRVTSAGGMFYDMQKKQSDSIWGQLQRITDAMDLMLNEIGQSNEGVIKFVLSSIRELINSWRMLAPYIKAAAVAMGSYMTISLTMKALPILINNMRNGFAMLIPALRSATTAQAANNATVMANPYAALASAILTAITLIWQLVSANDALTEAMDRVRQEGIGNMYNLIIQYEQLTKTVKDTNKSYDDRKKALEELHRVFGNILPDEMLEEKYIRNIGDNYKAATEAIKAFSAEKIKSNLKSEIENIVGKDIASQTTDLTDWITFNFRPSEIPKETFRSFVKTVFTEVSEEVKNGSISVENALDEVKNRITDRLSGIVSDDWINRFNKIGKGTNLMLFKNIREWENALNKFQDQINGIDIGFDVFGADGLDEVREKYKTLQDAVDDYKQKLEQLYALREKGKLGELQEEEDGTFVIEGLSGTEQQALDEFNASLLNLQSTMEGMNLTWQTNKEEINTALDSNVDKLQYFDTVTETTFNNALTYFHRWGGGLTENDYVGQLIEGWNRDAENLKLTNVQNEVIETERAIADSMGVSIDIFKKLGIEGVKSHADVKKESKTLMTQTKETIEEITNARIELIKLGWSAAEAQKEAESRFGAGKTQSELEQIAKAYEHLWRAEGGGDKKTKKTQDEELKKWQNIKKAIEEVSTEYDKLRKSYDIETSNKRIEELYGKVFEELGSDIKLFYKNGAYNAEELIKALRVLQGEVKATTEERKKFRSEVERSIDKAQVDIDLRLRKDAEDELKRQIEGMINTYELGKEFTGLGLPVELTMMLGKEPIKSPEDLMKLLQKGLEEAGGKDAPENIVKQYKDAMDKVSDIIFKNQKEQIKNYNKYLIESMGERVQMELKAMQDINKIREDANLDAFSKEQAIMQRRKQLTEDLAKFDFDKLKASDIYINTFKDLESASKQSLQYVIDKLEELKSVNENLSVSQVRALNNEIKKAQEALMEQNALPDFGKNLKDAIKYAKQRNQLILDQIDLQKQLDDRKEELDGEQKILYRLIEKRNVLKQGTEEWNEANNAVLKQQMRVSYLENEVKRLGGEVEDVNDKISQGELAWKGVQAAVVNVHSKISQAKDAMDSLFAGLDSMGLVNDAFRDTFESISEIIGGLDTVLSGLESIDITKPFSIITGSIKAIGGVFQAIGGFFGIGDKKKEREIKRLQKSVEELDKSYQKLEKSIEAAFTINQYNAGYNQMQKTLEAEKSAYEEMIRLEKAKKKTDNEKLQEYYDALDEIAEKQEELHKQRLEMMGSTTDYWTEAGSWLDTWLDAYKENGSGLEALGDSWDEFYENLIKKQAASAIVTERMKNFISQINGVIDAEMDEYSTAQAMKEIGERFKTQFANMNQQLIDFFEAAGIKGGSGEYVLSDLQKGIQNITEPQAAAIEAYLNSMRFAVYRHTEQLDILITTIQAQYGVGESPILQEVRLIRSVVESINTQLSRVIISKNGTSQYKLSI